MIFFICLERSRSTGWFGVILNIKRDDFLQDSKKISEPNLFHSLKQINRLLACQKWEYGKIEEKWIKVANET